MDLFGDTFWTVAGPLGVALAMAYYLLPPLVVIFNWGKNGERHASLYLWFVVLGWPSLLAIYSFDQSDDGRWMLFLCLGWLINLLYYGAWLVLYGVVRGIVTWIDSARPAADD